MKQIEQQVPMFHGHLGSSAKCLLAFSMGFNQVPTKLPLGLQQSYKEHRFPRAIYAWRKKVAASKIVFFFYNQIQIVEGNE